MKTRKHIRKIALKMQTKAEKGFKGFFGSPFLSNAWGSRAAAIRTRVKKQGKTIIKKTSNWVSKRSLKKHGKTK